MVFIIYYDQPTKKEFLLMSSLHLLELNNRLQLLRKQTKLDTEEEFHHAVQRFNDLSAFLHQVIGKELQATN